MHKAAYFADEAKPSNSEDINFSIIGDNTGNEAFIHAISKLIRLDRLPRHRINSGPAELADYDAFVTSDLIWIRQGAEAPESIKKLLDDHPNKKVVTISIGLQSARYMPDFQLSPDMIKTLQRVADRATLAIRGSYTAEILYRNGIRNIEIIGCPSVYQFPLFHNDFSSLLSFRDVRRAVGNFRTFYEPLKEPEEEMLNYMISKFQGFVEQTKYFFPDVADTSSGTYGRLKSWLDENQVHHFWLSEWIEYVKNFDFSMGSRFHGNVVAMLGGIRALLIVIDTRTQELSEFFSFPSIPFSEFDPHLPLNEYFLRADFSNFISDYHNKVSRFGEFLAKNDLEFSEEYIASLEKFAFDRIGKPWPGRQPA